MLKVLEVIIGILLILYNYRRERLISSSTIWIVCYLLVFVLTPLVNTVRVYHHEFLIDVLSFIGIIIFGLGIWFGNKSRRHGIKQSSILYTDIQKNYVFMNSYVFYWIIFGLVIISLLYSIGTSGVRQVLSGSLTSTSIAYNGTISVNNLYSYFLYLLIPCLLLNWFSSSNLRENGLRIRCLVSFVIINALFSFTRIFLVCTVAIIVLNALKDKAEHIKAILLFVIVASGMILMSFLNLLRGLGLGNVSWKSVTNFDLIVQGTDFGASYYWFDRLLDIPSPHINPIVYFKVLYCFIPRAIWTSKPEQMSLQILRILDPKLAASGYSTAGNSLLGEGYAVIGFIGVILFPFIWGIVCEKIDRAYYTRRNNGDAISIADLYYYIFSVFIVISAHRGDWSQYMLQFVWFMMVPIYLMVKCKFVVKG